MGDVPWPKEPQHDMYGYYSSWPKGYHSSWPKGYHSRVVAPFLCIDLRIQIYSYEVLQLFTELQIYIIIVTKGFQAMLQL